VPRIAAFIRNLVATNVIKQIQCVMAKLLFTTRGYCDRRRTSWI